MANKFIGVAKDVMAGEYDKVLQSFDAEPDGSIGIEAAIGYGILLTNVLTLKHYQDSHLVDQVVDTIVWNPLWKKIRWCDRHPYDNRWIDMVKDCVKFNKESKESDLAQRYVETNSISIKNAFKL